jgi:hypothetical protein
MAVCFENPFLRRIQTHQTSNIRDHSSHWYTLLSHFYYSAMTPFSSHVLMALPATNKDLKSLYREILNSSGRKRQVATNRRSASFDIRGLQIQHIQGLCIDLIQKNHRTTKQGNHIKCAKLLKMMLLQEG